ncbi:ribosomal RNA small subunit methyltransferase A [candidate division KSB1 bacterium 4572_119]|nr:MAG: ribosomal RNA small subunit methyltransferase A [candidate division KSB1 bacterium 4572_119]
MQDYKIRPKKSLGQNFLKDENIVRKIVNSLNLNNEDSVLEIGAGKGVLTKYLVQSDAEIFAVEIDDNLVKILDQLFRGQKNFKLWHGDILKLSFEEILSREKKYKALGNLPYHITSPVLFKIFENREYFSEATFMIQKEVAQRIVSQPGSKEFGILSVFSQFYADVEKLFDVSKFAFSPAPDVTSSVVKWKFKKKIELTGSELDLFMEIVKKVFSQRRKMLRNSLKLVGDTTPDLSQLSIDLKKRPEQLFVQDFIKLTKEFAGLKNP